MRPSFARTAVVIAFGLAACGTSGGERDPAGAIGRVLDEQVAAWNRGDLDAFMEGYLRSRIGEAAPA